MNKVSGIEGQQYTIRGILLIILGILLVAGCATWGTAKPTKNSASQAIESAKIQLRNAQEAKALSYAPQEFKQAQETLDKAREALNKGDYGKAAQLADKAASSAKQAQEKAQSKKKTEKKR